MASPRIAAAAALTLVMLIAPAAAQADVEPNNGLLQAEGPLVGGQTYVGTTGTSNDVDWYMFYANSQVELDIAGTAPDECWGQVILKDANGSTIDSIEVYRDSVYRIQYTTPVGVNRFYLVAHCDVVGSRYQFTINPASSVTTGPSPFAAPAPLGEPNEARSQAIGPLAGGVDYEGVQGTANDVDWFYFYAAGPRGLTVTTTGRDECYGDLELYAGEKARYVGTAYSALDDIQRIDYTVPAGVTKMFIKAGCGSTNHHYQFRIDPADAVVAQPPAAVAPVTSPACFRAKARRAFYRNRVRRLKRKVARTTSTRKYVRYRRTLKQSKLRYKRAKRAVRVRCA